MRTASSEHYVLVSALAAVRIGAASDSSKAGLFVTLPAGATVALDGASSISGLVDVFCDGARYAIFRVDLEERAELVVDAQ